MQQQTYLYIAKQNQGIVTFFLETLFGNHSKAHTLATISRNHSAVYPCVLRDRKRRTETETRGAALTILTAWSKKCGCSILQGEMGRLVRASCSDRTARALWPFIEIESVPRLGHNGPFYDSLCWH